LTEKRKAIVTVADNGIGIAPRDIPHMFTKFFRTKEAQAMDTEGLGVGLYLAKSIVKRFGGSLAVQSEGLDRGATFSLILPLAK
jgi:two-component system OmpR family sensor kinase